MSKALKFWLFIGFYILNVGIVGGFLLFADLGLSVNFTLAMYLIGLTALVSYALAQGKHK
jgi:hypothetical protein